MYEEIVQDVFSEGAPLSNEGDAYSKKTLEAVRQEIMTRHAPSSISSSRLPMKDAAIGDRCRTFAVSSSFCWTKYGVGSSKATSSGRRFFRPVVIDNTGYVAIGNNNLAAIAVDDANHIWGQGS
ncbi:hypothetical protein BT69DRAFT_1331317 [Atractiella rhizophila]|nr:hypothetical protein BT69DRAFT_1331317 [Atractiella rhizophila]